MEGLDVTNSQMVALNGDDIVIMRPKVRMTPKEAKVLAAWLVSMSVESSDEPPFEEYLRAVEST